MNRVITAASRSAAATLRKNHDAVAAPSSPAGLFAARHFSDSASAPPSPSPSVYGDEIKTGKVKQFDSKGRSQFGFIIPDGVESLHPGQKDLFFIHKSGIVMDDAHRTTQFRMDLREGERVKFKVAPPDKGAAGKAYDLTYECGKLVAAVEILPEQVEKYVGKQKAKFGDELYAIYKESTDRKELEAKIIAAFDNVKRDVERATERALMDRRRDGRYRESRPY